MAADPLTVEDLIARAIEAGDIVEGVNDPKTLQDLAEADQDVAEGRTYTHDQVRFLLQGWATK